MEPSHKGIFRSPLLHLPAELRGKVLSILLGGHIIHIGGTGHQPYVEGYLPYGRCSSCTASLPDEDCFDKYTLRQKPLKGALPEDRFSARHRHCHRYAVSRQLQLNILLVCKQFHREAASIVFEENTFALARPNSLGPFLERLNNTQLKSIRSIAIYSVESIATWIGPLTNYNLPEFLSGLLRLTIFIEIKPHDLRTTPPPNLDRRLSGLAMFKTPQLRQIDVMVLSPDWENVEADDLSTSTVERLAAWETRFKERLLST